MSTPDQEHDSTPQAMSDDALPKPPEPPSDEPPISSDQRPDETPPDPTTTTVRQAKPWALPVSVAAVALTIGLAGGFFIGQASVDPTSSDEYLALQADRDDVKYQLGVKRDEIVFAEDARIKAEEAVDEITARETALSEREQELDTRETDLDTREAGITATEEQVAANTITPGRWTVGVDIEPGSYRVAEPVTATDCYWAITASGTNGDDIISNDFGTQGNLSVTLSAGQDFESQDCGSWVKQ